VYETERVESFKVNEVIEFVGVLSNDPAMVSFPGEQKYVATLRGVTEKALSIVLVKILFRMTP